MKIDKSEDVNFTIIYIFPFEDSSLNLFYTSILRWILLSWLVQPWLVYSSGCVHHLDCLKATPSTTLRTKSKTMQYLLYLVRNLQVWKKKMYFKPGTQPGSLVITKYRFGFRFWFSNYNNRFIGSDSGFRYFLRTVVFEGS